MAQWRKVLGSWTFKTDFRSPISDVVEIDRLEESIVKVSLKDRVGVPIGCVYMTEEAFKRMVTTLYQEVL